MRIAIFTLTDDPFDAPGIGGHGGSHVVMFDMGRHFVRAGASVIFVTRRDHEGKSEHEKIVDGCEIFRLSGGPISEIPMVIVIMRLASYSAPAVPARRLD
jgi:hypothetical protein